MDKTHADCPECQSRIKLPATPELYMRLTCPECGTPLEIVNEEPWELDFAYGDDQIDEVVDTLEQDYADYEDDDLFEES